VQETIYRGVTYDVQRLDDGTWQWFIQEGNFGGREKDQEKAIAQCKASVDGWLSRNK
jgi:hypothetical protein